MTRRTGLIVVMPAYNAARTLEKTYNDLPRDLVDKIILVDDVSQDETVEIAHRLGLKVVIHIQNKGYGGNQKTCYLEALREGAEIVVMLHPDYQYDSRLVPGLIGPIQEGKADLVLGSRFLSGTPLAGGMPLYKYIANHFLTLVENLVLGQIPFLLNSDKFLFDTEVIAQAVAFCFKIDEIAVPTRYFEEASSVNFRNSVIYGLGTLCVMVRFLLDRLGLWPDPRFRKKLREIISPYYAQEILGEEAT